VTGDRDRLQSQIFGTCSRTAGVVIIALVGAAWLSWRSAGAVPIGPPIALVLAIFGSRIRKASRRRQDSQRG